MTKPLGEVLSELVHAKTELAALIHDARLAAEAEVLTLAKVNALLDVWEEALPREHAWAVHELAKALGRQPWGGQQALVSIPERVRCGAVLPTPPPFDGLARLRCGLDQGHGGPHTTGQVRWFA